MERSRQQLLAGAAAATVGAAAVGNRAAAAPSAPPSVETIAGIFAGLPGTFAFTIVAPATVWAALLDISSNPAQMPRCSTNAAVGVLVTGAR